MNTLAPEVGSSPASFVTRPTPEYLLEAPLPQLLAEMGAELVESSITDAAFTGAAVVYGGSVLLSMPSGRPVWEREAVARALLGDAIGVPLPPLPSPYTLTEV